MKFLFFGVFNWTGEEYQVTFPDFPALYTHGETLEDAIEMAREVLEGFLLLLEERQEEIPSPTPIQDLNNQIKLIENSNIFPIQANTRVARARNKKKYDRKTVTIEHHVNVLANERKINLSKTLNDALIDILV